jgi:flagellar biogenesis protein FliO
MNTVAWMLLGCAVVADPGASTPNLPIVKPRDYRSDASVKSATYHRTGAAVAAEAEPVSAAVPAERPPVAAEKPGRTLRRLKPRSKSPGAVDPSAEEPDEDGDLETGPVARKSSGSKAVAWWVSTGVGLVVVLTFIFLGGKAVRSMAPGLAGGEFAGPVHVLFRTLIGPKQSICLLRCGQRLLLVGVTGEGMQTLADITDPEEIDLLKGQCMQLRPKSTTRAFADLLRGNAKDVAAAETVEPRAPERPAPANAEFAKQLHSMKAKLLDWKAREST